MYNWNRDYLTIDSSLFRKLLLNRSPRGVEINYRSHSGDLRINMLIQLFLLGTLWTKVKILPHFRDCKTSLSWSLLQGIEVDACFWRLRPRPPRPPPPPPATSGSRWEIQLIFPRFMFDFQPAFPALDRARDQPNLQEMETSQRSLEEQMQVGGMSHGRWPLLVAQAPISTTPDFAVELSSILIGSSPLLTARRGNYIYDEMSCCIH